MSDTHLTVDDSLPQSVMEQVDSVCDRFEDAWLAGQRPRIDDFLAEVSDERVRQALVKELIALDIYHRQKLGETILPCDYERFSPQPADALAATGFETPAAPARYRFGEKVGVGGMGEVRRGRDLHLDRELAIKVLRVEHKGEAHLQRRFLEEARIGGRLQHPGIVPVHDLGELSDGRPFFTMKLVEGRTLEALLDERAELSQDLPRFLTIFEHICQTLGYAHAQGVIHRDLKPANVMVGAFGEVQVMDWGLAKVLKRSSVGEAAAGGDTVVYGPVEEDTSWQMRTQQGQAMGTYAYMPPEQARGEIERVDQRSDVFGLGAILCEILTGGPPFTSRDRSEIFAAVKACDHAEAMARLNACGADAELLELARTCLSAKPEDRPRNAGAVAETVKSYLTGVQERLRAAERERAAAQARAEEARRTVAAERRARRRMVWAALAMLLLIVGAGGGAWWQQWKQERADKAVENGLGQAEMLEKQAKEAPLEPGKYGQALEAARVAAELAKGASDAVRARANELVARLEREEEAAERDRRLLAALLEVHNPHEGPRFKPDDKGMGMALAEPTMEEQFASAFRDWGLDVEEVPAKESAALLKARPAAVVTEVIAALDEWASQLRQHRKPEAAERVAELAATLDDDPDSLRRELREILTRRQLSLERALSVLSAALRPVPIPVEVPLGKDRLRLRKLAEKTNPANEPILGLLTLTRALRVAGEEALAERLLRAALTARPQELVLYHTLGQLLTTQTPPRWDEAVEFYRAARVLRPDLGVSLAEAFRSNGREAEALDLLAWLVKENRDNPFMHFQRGRALYHKGDLDGAIACYHTVLELYPKVATAHTNLGIALAAKHDLDGAIACYHKALELDPNLAQAHCNLGNALYAKHDQDGAIACYHRVLELYPEDAWAHTNLGNALYAKGDQDGAIACYHKALELDPKYARAYYNLGNDLAAKHDLDSAIACYHKALEFDAKNAQAHNNLGNALYAKGDQDGAIACYHKALELNPKLAQAHNNLGTVLHAKHDLDGAIACFKKALNLDPKDDKAHYNLGNALYDKGDLDGAIACYKKAIALEPKYVTAHYNLGIALRAKGDLDGAIACYKKAVALAPDHAEAHCNLGNALGIKGDLDRAIACYHKALELNPKLAQAHGAMGQALLRRGRYAAARQSTRRALELLPADASPRRLALQQLQQCDRLLALEQKLPAILTGTAAPANSGEAVALASLCQQPHKKQYAASARLYADAFAAEPKIAADLNAQHRYNAACSAALASAGKGEDARSLPDKATAMFRRWALDWLRDDLTAYSKIVEQNNPAAKRAIQKRLSRWQHDPDLAGLRDKDAVDKLPQVERDACRKLWADVADLLKRIQDK